jgi:hypothetical protein
MQATPDGIAVDATSVYWRNGFSDTIMKVSVNGGAPIELGSGGQGGGPGNIALDGTNVYWTSSGGVGDVRKVPLDGGAVVTLAGAPDLYSDGIAVDAVSVYWTGVGGGNGISVMKVPLDGGTVVTLASGQGTQGSDFPIATDGRSLYWPVDTCPSDGGSCVETLQTMSVDGGTETTLASGIGNTSIAVDSANVYCTGAVCLNDGGACAGVLLQVPLVVGAPSTILASTASLDMPIAIDTTNVYYWALEANLTSGSLMRLPIGGGHPVTLASGQPAPVRMVVGATSVYWTTGESNSGGAVMKLTPK